MRIILRDAATVKKENVLSYLSDFTVQTVLNIWIEQPQQQNL